MLQFLRTCKLFPNEQLIQAPFVFCPCLLSQKRANTLKEFGMGTITMLTTIMWLAKITSHAEAEEKQPKPMNKENNSDDDDDDDDDDDAGAHAP